MNLLIPPLKVVLECVSLHNKKYRYISKKLIKEKLLLAPESGLASKCY